MCKVDFLRKGYQIDPAESYISSNIFCVDYANLKNTMAR